VSTFLPHPVYAAFHWDHELVFTTGFQKWHFVPCLALKVVLFDIFFSQNEFTTLSADE